MSEPKNRGRRPAGFEEGNVDLNKFISATGTKDTVDAYLVAMAAIYSLSVDVGPDGISESNPFKGKARLEAMNLARVAAAKVDGFSRSFSEGQFCNDKLNAVGDALVAQVVMALGTKNGDFFRRLADSLEQAEDDPIRNFQRYLVSSFSGGCFEGSRAEFKRWVEGKSDGQEIAQSEFSRMCSDAGVTFSKSIPKKSDLSEKPDE